LSRQAFSWLCTLALEWPWPTKLRETHEKFVTKSLGSKTTPFVSKNVCPTSQPKSLLCFLSSRQSFSYSSSSLQSTTSRRICDDCFYTNIILRNKKFNCSEFSTKCKTLWSSLKRNSLKP
jgi:hypothetical protein